MFFVYEFGYARFCKVLEDMKFLEIVSAFGALFTQNKVICDPYSLVTGNFSATE